MPQTEISTQTVRNVGGALRGLLHLVLVKSGVRIVSFDEALGPGSVSQEMESSNPCI